MHFNLAERNRRKHYAQEAFYILVVLCTVSTITYLLICNFFDFTPDQYQRLYDKCGGPESFTNKNDMFQHTAYIKTGNIAELLGAYYGILIDWKFLNGTPHNVNQTDLPRSITRLCITALFAFILEIPAHFLNNHHNIFVVYLFKQGIPFFLFSFFTFSYLKLILSSINLINTY